MTNRNSDCTNRNELPWNTALSAFPGNRTFEDFWEDKSGNHTFQSFQCWLTACGRPESMDFYSDAYAAYQTCASNHAESMGGSPMPSAFTPMPFATTFYSTTEYIAGASQLAIQTVENGYETTYTFTHPEGKIVLMSPSMTTVVTFSERISSNTKTTLARDDPSGTEDSPTMVTSGTSVASVASQQ